MSIPRLCKHCGRWLRTPDDYEPGNDGPDFCEACHGREALLQPARERLPGQKLSPSPTQPNKPASPEYKDPKIYAPDGRPWR